MSNALRYDSLLVRDLAAELDRTLAGARLDAAFLDRERLRMTLRTRAARRADAEPPSLQWDLHPASGHLVTSLADGDAGGRVQLGTHCFVRGVSTLPDERVLVFDLHTDGAHAGAARRIVVELITNQWNAVAIGGDGRITAVLRERASKERELRAGVEWLPPRASGRAGAVQPVTLDEWRAILGAAAPGERLRAVLRVAYTSPVNAASIVGDADVSDDAAAIERAWRRYLDIVWHAPRTAVLLAGDGAMQPYSVQLADAAPQPTLLAAFDAAAGAAPPPPADDADDPLALIASRLESLDRRVERLQQERAGAAEEAVQQRHRADVLMAQLHAVQRGAERVELADFDGKPLVLELDPSLNAAQNATKLYDAARKRDRAAARIPPLLEEAGRERVHLEALAGRVREGAVQPGDLDALKSAARARADAVGKVLPYREYRTRGGLEVRVGRGSKANDELTFRHSSPTDVWLHARDVAGAHVILRWPHGDANPSGADIGDAAVLAALYSRARTSGVVAVDWTRRKWVRKPRKAAPGLVVPERVRTVFVEPDPALEEMLRVR